MQLVIAIATEGDHTMDEERFKIMQMLADGTITTDEADLLLEVIEAAPPAATGETQRIAPPWREAPKQPAARQPAEQAPQQPARTFANLTLEQLIELRIHGVDPEFIQQLRDTELGDLTYEQILQAGTHGVRPEFIKEMRAAGLGDLTFDQLI